MQESMEAEKPARAFYLCNGMVPTCRKTACYLRGGECRHTSDIAYAKNKDDRKFVRKRDTDYEIESSEGS